MSETPNIAFYRGLAVGAAAGMLGSWLGFFIAHVL